MKTNYKKTIVAASVIILGCLNVAKAQQKIAGCWSTSFYLCNDGTIRSFGNNDSLSLGIGTSTVSSGVPQQVGTINNVRSIAAGYYHGMAIKNDSTVWTWGGNQFGQLGDGSNTNKGTPAQVAGLSGIKAVSGGQAGFHSLALKANGTVYSWGKNTEGQLGIASPTSGINTPTLVPGLTGIVAIAGGEYHSIALKNDGTVWSWGRNVEGQLGNGTQGASSYSSTPVQATGVSSIIAIAGGRYWSAALRSDGTIWTWGQNQYAQLGNGTQGPTSFSTTAVQVAGITGVRAIAASAFHGLALLNDSTVRAWGRNSDGQYGNGTTSSFSLVPVTVIGANQIVEIKAGTNYSLFKKLNGALWAAGRNLYGQLGNGTMTAVENTIVATVSLCAGGVGAGIAEESAGSVFGELTISPNPSSGQFKIKDDMSQNIGNSNYEIEIYNMIGEKVLSTTKNKLVNGSIDISNQPNGIYHLTLKSGNNTAYKKLIKQ